MLLGGHVSIAGGVEKAPGRAAALGLRCMQIFTRNQTRWEAPPLREETAHAFRAERRRCRLRWVAAHGSYLMNLASPDRRQWHRSLRLLADELDRAALLGLDQLILHPGSHMGSGEAAGVARVARALDRILPERTDGGPRVLLEVTAGQGSCLGWRLEHLRDILAACRCAGRVGVCLDTCHVFAAGHDLRSRAAYDATFQALDRTLGLRRLEAFHLNDSRVGLGRRVDRHAHLGEGEIGAVPFRRLARDPRFRGRPGYLETPGGEDHYRENLAVLRSAGRRRGRRRIGAPGRGRGSDGEGRHGRPRRRRRSQSGSER